MDGRSELKEDPTSRRRSATSKIAQAYRDSQEVMSICLSLGVFVGGGFWLDVKYGWKPLFTISGVFLGLIGAGYSLRQLLQRMDQRDKRESGKDSGKPDGK